MARGTVLESTPEQRRELFGRAMGFEGLGPEQIAAIAEMSFYAHYAKGAPVFLQEDPCEFFYLVAEGLVKVFISSSSGICVTYLLAKRGEPLNLIGPFTGSPRILSAEAMQESVVACIPSTEFVAFALANPLLLANIMTILGKAIDSANSRIVDMVEKRVEQRLVRVLTTLFDKFGSEIKLTSGELAELAGTTTESTLRTMGRLRSLGIVESRRGQVRIISPTSLKNLEDDPLWV
ncbi:MAG: Crp/Fnr family transcriptional regulator [Desulfarculaceae bacterium]|nr:Crp/Fnr family transcriptional regulator [Desulfarculaceae bacterium]